MDGDYTGAKRGMTFLMLSISSFYAIFGLAACIYLYGRKTDYLMEKYASMGGSDTFEKKSTRSHDSSMSDSD